MAVGSVFVARKFTWLNPPSHGRNRTGGLEEFVGHGAIVVLGDPGSGKSTLFGRAQRLEPFGAYFRVGEFLEFPDTEFSGKTLYLDALDELRARQDGGQSTIDRVAAKLIRLGRPTFRLSCRAAEWYGAGDRGGDEQTLKRAAQSADICVLQLEPLSDSDIVEIANAYGISGQNFLSEAKRRGVHEWLSNPLNLELLLEVIVDNQWPPTRAEMFRLAVEKLVVEHNPEHERSTSTASNKHRLLDQRVSLVLFYCWPERLG